MSFSFSNMKIGSGSLRLSASSFNFEARRVNSLCGFTFDVSNTGTEPLIINSVSCSSLVFYPDNTNVTFPLVISPGGVRTLRIWFNPKSAGSYYCKAVISSTADNLPEAEINLSGTAQDNISSLGDIFWAGNIPDNPGTSVQDYQPKSIKRIGDVNGDGINDVIVGTENYWTICFNGNASLTADTLWKFNTYFGTNNTGSVDWEDAMDVIPDINNDGKEDVIIGCGGGNEMVYALSGATGQKLWQYGSEVNNYDGDIYGLRTDKDYNGDSKPDVLISASGETNGGRHAVICVNGLNGQEIFNVPQNSNFTADIESNTNGGAIGTSFNGGPYTVNGFTNTGTSAWSYTTTSTVWSLKRVPDINSDGVPDIVGMYGFSGGMFALSGSNGAQIWTASLGSSNNGKITRLDDKNGNGFIDIANSGPQSLNRIDSKTGAVLWSVPLASSYIRGIDDIGDVTGDALHDIAVMTQVPGKLVVLNGNDGGILFEYVFGNTLTQRGDRVIAVNSIDTGTTKEMIAGCRDGRIKCFSGGPGIMVGVSSNTQSVPNRFALNQNYPNPFNPVSRIQFSLPENSKVKLIVYNILGKEISRLVNDELKTAGSYTIEFNGSDLPSGVYFYKLTAGDFTDTKKMILVK